MRSTGAVLAIWLLTTLVTPAAVASAGQDSPLPEGRGRDILQSACTTCHSLERIVAKRLDKESWQTVIDTMKDEGARMAAGDEPTLLSYLVDNFGPSSAPPDKKSKE